MNTSLSIAPFLNYPNLKKKKKNEIPLSTLLTQLAAATLNNIAPLSPVEYLKAKFFDQVSIRSIISRPDGGTELTGQRVQVGGWVKTGQMADKDAFAFLELNNESGPGNLQVIVDAALADLSPLVPTGKCVAVNGVLKLPPVGIRQKVELWVEKVIHVGQVDPAKYPLPRTRLTLEFLRDHSPSFQNQHGKSFSFFAHYFIIVFELNETQ